MQGDFMFIDATSGRIDAFTKRLVRLKAKQLIGMAGLRKGDRDDLEQDLFMRVLQATPSYKPEAGHWRVFITAVIERHCATILRNRSNPKRDDRFVDSLNENCEVNGVQMELAQSITDRDLAARLGRDVVDETRVADRTMDVATALEQLPPDLRDLADRLAADSIADVARQLGVPRTTLYTARARLRAHFVNLGIENFL
jgi:RNA polymerase sigma-70 factor (ECF subfamily)